MFFHILVCFLSFLTLGHSNPDKVKHHFQVLSLDENCKCVYNGLKIIHMAEEVNLSDFVQHKNACDPFNEGKWCPSYPSKDACNSLRKTCEAVNLGFSSSVCKKSGTERSTKYVFCEHCAEYPSDSCASHTFGVPFEDLVLDPNNSVTLHTFFSNPPSTIGTTEWLIFGDFYDNESKYGFEEYFSLQPRLFSTYCGAYFEEPSPYFKVKSITFMTDVTSTLTISFQYSTDEEDRWVKPLTIKLPGSTEMRELVIADEPTLADLPCLVFVSVGSVTNGNTFITDIVLTQ